VRIRTVPSGSTRPERYFRRAISSIAARFSRNTAILFLLSPWKWSSSASWLMAHRIRLSRSIPQNTTTPRRRAAASFCASAAAGSRYRAPLFSPSFMSAARPPSFSGNTEWFGAGPCSLAPRRFRSRGYRQGFAGRHPLLSSGLSLGDVWARSRPLIAQLPICAVRVRKCVIIKTIAQHKVA
jgi:hypothetical protein